MVRPNFRIGNTLMTSSLIYALQARFPGAAIDTLSGDTTASLLENLPINLVHRMSRNFLLRPWRLAALFLRVRRARYDVAVESGKGSFSGMLCVYITGAQHRIGCGPWAPWFCDVRLQPERAMHAHDDMLHYARALGATCPDRPVYAVSSGEKEAARAHLAKMDLADDRNVSPFIAVFMGGHQDKRWPSEDWLDLAGTLGRKGAPLLVLLGPEEVELEGRLRRTMPTTVRVLPPQSLRAFAALLSEARLIVTPDTGPMHLAVAVGVPTIAILQTKFSIKFGPRGAEDHALLKPSVGEVVEAVTAHPSWRDVIGSSDFP